jgi:hypothetical protein
LFGQIPSQQVKISTPRKTVQAKKRGKQPKKRVFSFFFMPLKETILLSFPIYLAAIFYRKKKS